ncbi:MAG: DEAD/DEAH box helicase, partial [Candidatus Lindowbacteria bacterium]|nr:DEAD/DEAH box helicase [Candidatus Lindowbacteria bacterium]
PLGDSIADMLDLNQDDLPLNSDVAQQIELSEQRMRRCLDSCREIMRQCEPDLGAAGWYSDDWLNAVVRNSSREFNGAFDRWRELYKTAHRQLVDAQETTRNAHRNRLSREEQQEALRREIEAQRQKDLLCKWVNRDDSDFYPYRYLASEGFLPGYNFPRLPIRAFIPREEKESFIARPRFLALSEFGPRNILYHEGRKYRVVRSLIPPGDPESRFTRAKICGACGAFHTGDGFREDLC